MDGLAQDLLNECDALVNEGEWDQVLLVLERVNNSPNYIRRNLEGAMGYISSRDNREKGSKLIQEFMEHLEQVCTCIISTKPNQLLLHIRTKMQSHLYLLFYN